MSGAPLDRDARDAAVKRAEKWLEPYGSYVRVEGAASAMARDVLLYESALAATEAARRATVSGVQ